MKKEAVSILSIILTLILLTILTTISTAEIDISSRPQHKGIVCIYCHETKGFSIGEHEDEGGCDNCHSIKDNIPAIHSNVCSKCHTTPSSDEEYHNTHKNVDCTKCHGTGILPVKPTTGISNCAACHGVVFSGGSNIHITHKARLEEICSICHGSIPSSIPVGVTESVPPTSEKTNIVEGISEGVGKINKKVYAKVIDYNRYTLYEIFKVIFSIFH